MYQVPILNFAVKMQRSSEKARIRGFQTTFPLFFFVCRLKAGQ
ncbi:hypothetical protein HMPREF1051_2999 [Neisseria sicca VK64]|uniref:Uncharacterized protein n=1 Tax=Neisseria sicca VK64 TaxID=1095748 RepID=I2NGC5_NEISI|nr:hypothetical protein HMPREF1051_2999 [Neisseria sicca VK64]